MYSQQVNSKKEESTKKSFSMKNLHLPVNTALLNDIMENPFLL